MREFFINDRSSNKQYRFSRNYIKTTKYNALSYLPLSILYQFKRFANIYFLIISILSAFPSISPFDPLSSTVPFVFVVLVSVVRDGIEDLARYKSDREINRVKVTQIKGDGTTAEIYSSNIEVGDILFIKEDTMFPSDLILVESSSDGACFIQTSSLDGEKNLKKRLKPKDFYINGTQELTPSKSSKSKDKKQEGFAEGQYPTFKGRCECDEPNAELYEFSGNLKYDKKSYALNASQLLLKGSILKNTQWVIGYVVYTGNETKLMMNAKEGRFKQSQVEEKMNKLVIVILGIQIMLCLLVSFVGINWYRNESQDYKYLYLTDALQTSFIQTFFRYFLLLNTLIPISLIVTIEVVKVVQAYFIQNDALMYSQERDRPAKVSSASLNEELGQISYIFSDKTGTLTRNIMEFKLAQIGSRLYGDGELLDYDKDNHKIQQKVLRFNKKQGTQYTFKNKQIEEVLYGKDHLEESSVVCDFKVKSKSGKITYKVMHQQILVMEFMKLLSAAHQCMPETKKSNGMEEIFYQGPSPDEVTLVEFAQQHGYEFYFGNDNFAKVRVQKPISRGPGGAVLKWEHIRNIEFTVYRRMEFNSDRKRMSILVKDPDDGYYKLYVKGADSIIKERLDKKQIDEDLMDIVDDFLTRASVKGYRTLLMAMKVLDEDEVKEFLESCERAEQNLLTREVQLQKVYSDFERNLVLVGATCVEDRLQDNVPDTINDLQNAGIKIWMLTGDKLETAENIGYSCNLLNRGMHIIKCSNLADVKREFNSDKGIENEEMMKKQIQRGILIEAGALKHILEDDSFTIKRYFLKIAKTCEAVICCRVSPAQKADVVKLIKDDDKKIVTLAIGDGANDVSMILEAHIGIGLYGNEGMRAVQSGDYALGEFQYLWRLILIHGRWAYIRNCELILYFFYKNIVFTLPQVFYAFVAAYSGQTIYDDWYITFYNLFFTSLPLMVKALFDQDINPTKDGDQYKRYLPKLYYVGQRSVIFNTWTFLFWLFMGVTHSLIVFVVPLYIFKENIMNIDADNNDMWSFSVTSFTCVILVSVSVTQHSQIVTIRLMVTSRYLTWINLVSIFILSLGVYFTYVWASNYTGFSQTYLSMTTIWGSGHFYLTILLCVGFCYIVDLFVESWNFEIWKNPGNFLRKIVDKGGNLKKYDQEFQQLYGIIKTRYVEEDIEREVKVEEKRDLKVNKYGPNKFKDIKKKVEKKGPKNEIELEFLAQDEKEKYYEEKYNKSSDESEEGYTSPDKVAQRINTLKTTRNLMTVDEQDELPPKKKFVQYEKQAKIKEEVKKEKEKNKEVYYRPLQSNRQRQPSQTSAALLQTSLKKGYTSPDKQTYGERFKNTRTIIESQAVFSNKRSQQDNNSHIQDSSSKSQTGSKTPNSKVSSRKESSNIDDMSSRTIKTSMVSSMDKPPKSITNVRHTPKFSEESMVKPKR